MNFDTLLPLPQWVWQASGQAVWLVVLVLATLRLCGHRLSPRWRHALWLLVVVRLILPVSWESHLSIYNHARVLDWADFPNSSRASLDPAAAAPISSTLEVPPLGEAGPDSGPLAPRHLTPGNARAESSPVADGLHQSVRTSHSVSSRFRGEERIDAAARSQSGLAMPGEPEAASRWFRILVFTWLAGVAAFSLRFAWGNLLFQRRVRRGKPIGDAEVLALFEALRLRMKVGRKITLVEMNEVESPALFGLFRVWLVLPEHLTVRFSREELRFVFLHELAHLKRGDLAVSWLLAFLRTLHWFNPLLWLAFARLRVEREMACDALALEHAAEGENTRYGRTVLKLLESFTRPSPAPGLIGILEGKKEMKERITMIAQFNKNAPRAHLAVALLLLLGLISLTDARSEPEPPPSAEAQAGQAPSAEIQRERTEVSTLVQDARLLIEMGNLDEAKERLQEAVERDPEHSAAISYLQLINERLFEQEARNREVAKEALLELTRAWNTRIEKDRPPHSNPNARTNLVFTGAGRHRIFHKLDNIILPEVVYDGLPLSEVVRDLTEEARRRDPEGRGINFIINPNVDNIARVQPQPFPQFDPATGQQFIPQVETEEVDLYNVTIRLHLTNARLADVLDAVTKVADHPLKYSVEDYAVVFTQRFREPEMLYTRTFKVDPNIFLQGLGVDPNSFLQGLGLPAGALSPTGFGAPAGTRKALFYNDRQGIVFARATLEELDILEKAIQVLNDPRPRVTLQSVVARIRPGFALAAAPGSLATVLAEVLEANDPFEAQVILNPDEFRVLRRFLEEEKQKAGVRAGRNLTAWSEDRRLVWGGDEHFIPGAAGVGLTLLPQDRQDARFWLRYRGAAAPGMARATIVTLRNEETLMFRHPAAMAREDLLVFITATITDAPRNPLDPEQPEALGEGDVPGD